MGHPAEQLITRTIVSDVRLPEVKATDRVQIREITIPPSRVTGPHLHNGPVFGSIVAGSVIYQIDGRPRSCGRATCSTSPKPSGSSSSTPSRTVPRSWPTSWSPRARNPS